MFSINSLSAHEQEALHGSLACLEEIFDPKAGLIEKYYDHVCHKIIYDGGKVYATTDSARYALLLTIIKKQAAYPLIKSIIDKVIATQDTNPDSKTYGLYPYYQNYGFDKWLLPDYNWAVFIGNIFMEILESEDFFEEALRDRINESLKLAAECIRRRNVHPEYTNIAIHSLPVLIYVGQKFDKSYLDFARNSIRKLKETVKECGGFCEYLSSTYYGVNTEGLFAILNVSEDAEISQIAEELRDELLNDITAHYDPVRQQLAGPHARCYSTDITSHHTGVSLLLHFALKDGFPPYNQGNYQDRACVGFFVNKVKERLPNSFIEAINSVKADGRKVSRTFDRAGTQIHTYIGEKFSLGFVDKQSSWEQTNNLLAYWQDSNGKLAYISEKLRRNSEKSIGFYEKNKSVLPMKEALDKEFFPWCSADFRAAEKPDGSISVDYKIFENRGMRHFVDKEEAPSTSAVYTEFDLTASDAQCNRIKDGTIEIKSGDCTICLRLDSAQTIDGKEADIEIVKADDGILVRTYLYRGELRTFTWAELIQLKASWTFKIS